MQNRTKDLIGWDWIRTGPTEATASISLHETVRPLKSWREELRWAAEYIAAQNVNNNLVLALSGGVDSEVMARVFVEANIPFRAVTWRYNQYANLHDIKYAQTFCRNMMIDLEIVDIDLNQFHLKDIIRYQTLGYEFTHPAHAIKLKMIAWADEQAATLVAGEGDQILEEYNQIVHLAYTRDQPAFYDYIENHCVQKHFPLFFQQNIHMMRAYQEIDIIKLLLTSPKRYYQNKQRNMDKTFVYHSEWPEMLRRPKYHGWEKSSLNPPYREYSKIRIRV